MTNKIDTTGATLTPEMAQKGEEVKDEAAQKAADEAKATEEAKATKEAKAAEDAKKADDDAKAKADADKEGKSNLPDKKRSIYDDLKDKKKEVKEAKSEAEIARAENAALKAENEALKKLSDNARKATTDEEKEEIEEEIQELAKAVGGDPKAVKALTDFLTKKLVKTNGVEISKEDIEAVKAFKQEQAKMSAETEFGKEWKSFVPSLKKDFPEIDDKDLESVQKKIFELAHSTKFHDKEIDYIYFKNKEALSKLVSPKRPSMESAGNGMPGDESKAVADLSSRSSPMDVQNAVQRDRHSSSSLEIRKGKQ